ncbi:MAG: bifunctional riboflavin kinase/FAD synthetase [Chloroflexi bacterium]|nr:bifunctional riboflavin kinase/FAD synthetase [Chloroflexota bacterium]
MQLFDSLHAANFNNAWLTIGAFDGVHIGHQAILKTLTAGAHAEGAPAVVLSFWPHPVEVLQGPRGGFYLNSPGDKAAMLEALGVDAMITQPFDLELSQTTSKEFVERLKARLGLRMLWVGEDFALGHNREGDVPRLKELGATMDFDVRVVPPVNVEGEAVSSSRIRKLLADGEVKVAARLLGRNYALSGKVVRGAGRGAKMGIPTANLEVWPKRTAPASGVYACMAQLGEQRWKAVTNIGVRPTFEDKLEAPVVEALLLDYEGEDFYGEEIKLEFAARLRSEQKFESVEALLTQIERDKGRARDILVGK